MTKRTPEMLYRDSASEAQVRSTIMEDAHWKGWLVSYNPDSRKVKGDPGVPDLILARRGKIIAVELKSYAGRVRLGQRDWIDALGENVYLVKPATLDWFCREILT